MSRTAVKVVFGAMTFGEKGREGARTYTIDDCQKILDVFQHHGHNEVDTARIYSGGQSEEWIGELDWASRGLTVDTKLYPTKNIAVRVLTPEIYSFEPADLRQGLERSLQALKTEKISIFYLHAPDRKTPIEDTLREVNALYAEGKFERFGLSNFMAWEVAQICELADKHGWVAPAVYQGTYSALQRLVEPELFPCLRKYGMSFYAFSPLAGGFLTGRYQREQTEFEEGSRFDPKRLQGAHHRARFLNDAYFDALDIIKPAAEKNGLTVGECALRWLSHHSQLKREHGDAVIVGASNTRYLEQNLSDLEKGPLPENVLQALEAGWAETKGVARPYFH